MSPRASRAPEQPLSRRRVRLHAFGHRPRVPGSRGAPAPQGVGGSRAVQQQPQADRQRGVDGLRRASRTPRRRLRGKPRGVRAARRGDEARRGHGLRQPDAEPAPGDPARPAGPRRGRRQAVRRGRRDHARSGDRGVRPERPESRHRVGDPGRVPQRATPRWMAPAGVAAVERPRVVVARQGSAPDRRAGAARPRRLSAPADQLPRRDDRRLLARRGGRGPRRGAGRDLDGQHPPPQGDQERDQADHDLGRRHDRGAQPVDGHRGPVALPRGRHRVDRRYVDGHVVVHRGRRSRAGPRREQLRAVDGRADASRRAVRRGPRAHARAAAPPAAPADQDVPPRREVARAAHRRHRPRRRAHARVRRRRVPDQLRRAAGAPDRG